jgi:hypothetical protein
MDRAFEALLRWRTAGARERDRGQVLMVFAIGLVAILGLGSLGFDTGRFYTERRYLQNAADAGVLAVGAAMTRGLSNADAITEGRSIVARNILNSPTGSGAVAPADPPVYADGHAGEPSYLIDGVVINGGEIRVAVRGTSQWTLGRALGLGAVPIIAQARGILRGYMLPIAVRKFTFPPGPNPGAQYPCSVVGPHDFQALMVTAATSCLGSTTDSSQWTAPGPGMPYDSGNPNNDPTVHGPIQTFVGVNAKPNNAADFRGFIALDIRNFAFVGSNLFYNGVTAGMQATTLRDIEAAYVFGGYPGPDFPSVVSPPDANLQVALMDGNSSGTVLDQLDEAFAPGDEFMAGVYSGTVQTIPDFTLVVPNTVTIGTTQNRNNAVTFQATKNTSFAGVVDITAFKDWGDAQNPYGGTLQAFTFSPNPVTPAATVAISNFQTSSAPTGIYTTWIQGHSGSPYLTDHYYPMAVNIGNVNRDFNVSIAGLQMVIPTTGSNGTLAFTVSTPNQNASYFNGTVALAVEGSAKDNGVLPSGIGARTLSQSVVNLSKGAVANINLTINSGTLAPGVYDLTLAVWGNNGDGQKVTRLYPFSVAVATSSTQDEYIDLEGFAVFRITKITANELEGYAISDVYASQNDPALRRGQTVRLIAWN